MQKITGPQCGVFLAMWLGKVSAPENAKLVAKEVGFNDSPFFGAEKNKIQLMGELVMVNTALAIFGATVNRCVNSQAAILASSAFVLTATPFLNRLPS